MNRRFSFLLLPAWPLGFHLTPFRFNLLRLPELSGFWWPFNPTQAMPCVLPDKKIAYFPVPKCACTSIKLAWYEWENSRPFEEFQINGQKKHAHHLYPTKPFVRDFYKQYRDHVRIAIIRDPLKRLLSAYANRVHHYKELGDRSTGRIPHPSFSLPIEPEIDDFARYLGKYIKSSKSIRHHTAPFSHFLGKDLSFYTHLLKMEDFPSVEKTFRDLGVHFVYRKTQKSPMKVTVEELKPETRSRLLSFLKPDYKLLRDHYQPPC